MSGEGAESVLKTVIRRQALLALLADDSLDKPSIVSRLDVSRSTINRAISTLESQGLVERTDGTYRSTLTGVLVRRHLDETLSTLDRILEAQSLFEHAEEVDLPLSLFRNGTVVTVDEDRHGPVQTLTRLFIEATRVRSAGALFRRGVPRSIQDRLEDDEFEMRMIFHPTVFDYACTYYGPEVETAVTSNRHGVRIDERCRPVTVAIVDDVGDADETAVVVFYDESDEPVGLVRTTDAAGLAWARGWFDRTWERATPAADCFDAGSVS